MERVNEVPATIPRPLQTKSVETISQFEPSAHTDNLCGHFTHTKHEKKDFESSLKEYFILSFNLHNI